MGAGKPEEGIREELRVLMMGSMIVVLLLLLLLLMLTPVLKIRVGEE